MRRLNLTVWLLTLTLGLFGFSTQGDGQTLSPTVTPQATATLTNTPIVAVTANPTVVTTLTPNPTISAGNLTPTHTPVNFPAPLFLDANYFDPRTGDLGIHFKMDSDGQAKVSIYNMAGELVKTILDAYRNKGGYTIFWEGHNSSGALVGNALYYIVFQYPGGQTIQKVILLK